MSVEDGAGWSVKEMTIVRFSTVEEAQRIVDLCEAGTLHDPWKPTTEHPAHYVTERGRRIRVEDCEEARRFILREELKAELRAPMSRQNAARGNRKSSAARSKASQSKLALALKEFRAENTGMSDRNGAIRAAHEKTQTGWSYSYYRRMIRKELPPA